MAEPGNGRTDGLDRRKVKQILVPALADDDATPNP